MAHWLCEDCRRGLYFEDSVVLWHASDPSVLCADCAAIHHETCSFHRWTRLIQGGME